MKAVRASASSSLANPCRNSGPSLPSADAARPTATGPRSYGAVWGSVEEPEYPQTAILSVPSSESSSSKGPPPAPPQTSTGSSSLPLEFPSRERAEFINVPLDNPEHTPIYFPSRTYVNFSDWSPSQGTMSNSFDDDPVVESSQNWESNRWCLLAFVFMTPIAIIGVIVAIILYLMPLF